MTLTENEKPKWQRDRIDYNLETLLPLLLRHGEINKDQARLVYDRSREEGMEAKDPAGLDLLLKLALKRQGHAKNKGAVQVTEDVVLRTIAKEYGLEYKKIDYLEMDLEICTKTISESFARKNLLVPLRINNGIMEILVFNPFYPELWRDMERVTSMPYQIFLATRLEINRLIDDYFQFRLAIQAAEAEFRSGIDLGNMEGKFQVGAEEDKHSHQHIVKAVDYLLSSALRERSSDIHLEPKRGESLVRFRIDGVLHTLYRLPLSVHQAMISRIKSLARLDIAEKRRPQDGRIQMVLRNLPTDVRISTIPVAFGEKMVLRLLSSGTTLKSLEELGMTEYQQKIFQGFINQTYGLLLVTGPTGSGKSTTLYSTLKYLSNPNVNVVTVEEPIEMVVDEFNQIGVQTKIGVTFGSMLRYILRQDPDIIMIGEIRDLDTAEQAIQSSLTGHLVFSTLHTNDASSSLTRLVDIGVEPFLINASLVGVMAQRLVRCICPYCKIEENASYEHFKRFNLESYYEEYAGPIYRGIGCEHCRKTGYMDRIGIFEIIPFESDIKNLLRHDVELSAIRAHVRKKGIKSLLEAGLDKVSQGVTTLEEVLRVTGDSFE